MDRFLYDMTYFRKKFHWQFRFDRFLNKPLLFIGMTLIFIVLSDWQILIVFRLGLEPGTVAISKQVVNTFCKPKYNQVSLSYNFYNM